MRSCEVKTKFMDRTRAWILSLESASLLSVSFSHAVLLFALRWGLFLLPPPCCFIPGHALLGLHLIQKNLA